MKNKYDISHFIPVVTEQSITLSLVKRLKKRRKEMKMTQRELCIRSGVSYGSIRRFESSGDISLKSLLKISYVVGALEDFNNIFSSPKITNIKDMKE